MALPASELAGWEEYFSEYGFTNDLIEINAAKIIQAILNMSGRTRKNPIDLQELLPERLRTKTSTEISLEEQHQKALAYHAERHKRENKQ